MKTIGLVVLGALIAASSLAVTTRPASGDLRFCNNTSSDSGVIEGHRTAHDGLTVHGIMQVKKGTCGVIVSGRLTAPTYYVRIEKDDFSYGGDSKLCVIDGYEFTFRGEDEPNFKCQGKLMGDALHIPGFTNPPKHLVSFLSLATGGKATMILTQRLDRSIHVLVK
jgi:uncharacterized membrane protein